MENSFKAFVEANPNSSFNYDDYVYYYFSEHRLPPDLFAAIASIMHPDFRDIDGALFLDFCFDKAEFKRLKAEGASLSQIQYWLNVFPISDFLADLEFKATVQIAKRIEAAWNAKLRNLPDAPPEIASVLEDENSGDVFVILRVFDPTS